MQTAIPLKALTAACASDLLSLLGAGDAEVLAYATDRASVEALLRDIAPPAQH